MSVFLERLYGRCHSLPDALLDAQLVRYIFEESEATPWWALILRTDGQLFVDVDPRVGMGGIAPPAVDKKYFAKNLIIGLNRRCAYRGAWVVFWCEGEDGWQRLTYVWKDQDGDRMIALSTDGPWPRVKAVGIDKWIDDGDAAIRHLHLLAHNLQLRKEQTVKRAQGQTAPE